ncbi:MAG: DEAD/DEAH box helicase [Cyanobacteria bacterium J06598_3]
MHILHGTWIPNSSASHADSHAGHRFDPFVQTGDFYLWVETQKVRRFKRKPSETIPRHNRHLRGKELADFLEEEIGFSASYCDLTRFISPKYFTLPTVEAPSGEDTQPLPSLELARYLETDLPKAFHWQTWQVDCYKIGRRFKTKAVGRSPSLSTVFPQLKELHFMAQYQLSEVQLGADLLFWYHYTQAFKSVILKDQYIPALRYQQLAPEQPQASGKSRVAKARKIASGVERKMARRKSQKSGSQKSGSQKSGSQQELETAASDRNFRIYPHWEIVGESYTSLIERYVEHMPLMCGAGFADVLAGSQTEAPALYEPETLLRHFSDCLLSDVVARTPLSQAFEKQIVGSLVHSAIQSAAWTAGTGLDAYQQWQVWRDRITRTQSTVPFYFCFQLESPTAEDDDWQLDFKVAPKAHPSLRISLEDYWQLKPHQQLALKYQLGENFEQDLLLTLGDAARIYPELWVGLETDEPIGIELGVDAAFDFLRESAWVLEDAGYKVIVPAWWTPEGRRRAQLKLRASSKSAGKNSKSKSYFSLNTLVEYQYELSIGGERVSAAEWQQLVNSKTPLVQFRGEWIELDQTKMKEMMEFWQKHGQEKPDMTLLEFMKMAASQGDDIEIDFSRDRTLLTMMDQLNRKSALVPVDDPDGLNGTLRDYQKRGVSWLHYLESLGLNGCLADDMGLGKTVQVIARLVQEEESLKAAAKKSLPPTLLIAPTSVLGNWDKELERFAPHLTAAVHHGAERVKTKKEFKQLCKKNDLLITSFSLARRDSELLESVAWHRIVLDEAQNIKNPKAAQTKAILSLSGQHRLALTGTPVENRLLDLWSIFNFLNPGYLGKQAQFRKNFELPIQRNNDQQQAAVLKKLVEPFILRRVKTDESIIKDLPEKVEQKLYCNLTKEQASLYEATVRDVEKQLKDSEGIQRKGIILSTLMKLKQICNHPRQFLQDNSDFTPARSHKLSRLSGMVSEAIADGDSLLIFTQFKEIGDALEKYLHHTHHYNTYYLHGGTTRKKRERMMADFQAPDTEPSIFILSLKAGGVGITLTKANHVFHFDRWWNPAVEDQATDRAFRIGQQKNVFVHKFVTIGTLEERIDQMIEDKKKLAGAIVGSDESWLTELDNTAFKKLIALNKNAIMD